MSKMIMLFDKIGKDKYMHFFVGFLLYVILGLVLPNWVAFIGVCIVALLKELVYDKKLQKGTYEVMDIVFTLLPGIILLIT